MRAPAAPAVAASLNGRHVLLVEDHPADLYVYRYALARAGAAVQAVTDGPPAVSAMASGLPFDAVLLDLVLPSVRGTEVAARLRAGGFSGTIVGVSAYLTDEMSRLWLDAGCDAVVRKDEGHEAVVAALADDRRLP